MKTRKIVLIIAALLLIAAIAVGLSLVWYSYSANKIIVITGDADIKVNGWYCISDDNEDIDMDNDGIQLSTVNRSYTDELEAGNSITFKFQVTNNSKYDSQVSLRFNNTFDNLFQLLEPYVNSNGAEGVLSSELYEIANKYSGRLLFFAEKMYYEYEVSDSITYTSPQLNDTEKDMYLWKYSSGEYLIGHLDEDDLRPAITPIFLPGLRDELERNVNIYIKLSIKESATSISTYKNWLMGSDETPGEGHKYAANVLGLSLDELKSGHQSEYIDYINEYLEKLYDLEIKSIKANGNSKINFCYNYFEFMGEEILLIDPQKS